MKWPAVKLRRVTSKVGSGATPRGGEEVYKPSGIPLIRSMNVHFEGFRRKGLVFIGDEDAAQLDHVTVQPDDVLFNITGASIGRVTTAPPDMAGARVNQHVCILRTIDALVPQFLAYYMATPAQQVVVNSNQVGGTRQAVTKAMLLDWPVPLPAPREQRRIVELLEQADELRRQRAEADALADRILPALFHKMFGDPATNPKGWDKKSLEGASASVRYGLGQPPQASPSGLPLLRATNIHRGVITDEDMIYVSREDVPEGRDAFLKAEEVIVVRSGAYTGDVAQVTEEWAGSVAGYDLVVSPGARFTGEFLESYLLSSFIQRHYFGNIKARAGQPHLNADQLSNTPMLVPLKPLQEGFAGFVKSVRKQRLQRTESDKQLQNLFSTTLHRAFTGELTAEWREAHLKELLAEMEQQARLLRQTPPPD
jgi:type I restriction enzyme S subunit